jgi:hypothetical protein
MKEEASMGVWRIFIYIFFAILSFYKMSQNGHFFSFSEIQKLKMHIFKMFWWDTIGCTEKDLFEGAWEDMGNMERYRDITEGSETSRGTRRETGPWQVF